MWFMCNIGIRILCYILSLSTLCSGHFITTPRRWTVGEESQVCVILSAPATEDESITFEMREIIFEYYSPFYEDDNETEEEEEGMVLIPLTTIIIPQGTQSLCQNITLPPTEERNGEFTINGSLEGQNLSYTKPVAFTSEILQTFVQTDKYLYKPSQIVQFRILTIIGVFLQVSVEPYEEIWIENPSGIRLAQWIDVANDNGLIHLSFQLSDEPEEGEYKIYVETSSGKLYNRAFKVEEYVLPRFEVTINPPSYILGTTEIITFEVCAQYTFGQPVNGNVSLSVDNNQYGDSNKVVTRGGEISGCVSFSINASELSINGDDSEDNYGSNLYGGFFIGGSYVSSLTANSTVTEEGTGVELEANEVSVKISRTALRFKDISLQKYYKPELPYAGEVEVTFPDGSLASDEPMTICCEEICSNRTTNTEGNLKFAIPPHLDCDIRIFAPNYLRIPSNNSWQNIMEKSGIHISLKKYHSPSNSSLVIYLVNEELECISTEERIDFNLTVMFAVNQQDSASVTVQVISRGQIQFSETFNQTFTAGSIHSIDESLYIEPVQESSNPDLTRGYFTVIISLPKTVSPKAQILVWYARDDGEVVSDSRDVSIMKCLLNSVNLAWSTDKSLPGASASVSVGAEPMSLCSLGVVDKSVEILTPKKYLLTVKRILKLAQRGSVKEYDYQQVDDYQYCQDQQSVDDSSYTEETTETTYTTTTLPPSSSNFPISSSTSSPPCRRKKREALPSESEYENIRRSKRSSLIGLPWWPSIFFSDDVDALYMFDEAGVYVLSNFTLETRPCYSENNYDGGSNYNYFYNNYNYDYNYYNYYYYGDYGYYGGLGGLLGGGGGGEIEGGLIGGGSDLEENEDEDEDEDGADDIRTYFPETWIWSLFSVSIDGLYEEALTLPDTVTEWVGRAVCVHPSKGVGISNTASIITFKEFFVDLTLPPSVKRGEIFPVKISIFNYLNESLPIRLILESPDEQFDILADSGNNGGSGVRTTCVPGNDKTVISIRIQAREVGDVNISVNAKVQENATEDCGSGNVQQKSDILIKPIRVNFEGFLIEETQFKFVCTNDSTSETWNVTAPDLIVPDSARGYVAVVGDLMGPTLQNLGNLVLMPYGCGEQNMVNFAPNIFVMQYLDATNQDTEEIANKAIEFMVIGYQKELQYRHSDGSFSVFGERDESGSTWLTAFVLKCFGQASAYISIDEDDLSITRDWLKSKQDENGCFESVGKLFNKAMQGGVESESPSLLTAYVVISLIEAGENYNSIVINEALSCINASEPTTNPYSLAIKAYALALADSSDTQATLDKLLDLSTNSPNGLFWEFDDQYESSNGVAVETASYAVLAILTFTQNSPDSSDYTPLLLPIIKWINTQRNGQGGFISTQDTVIALQALAAFQATISSGPVDLTVTVTMGTVNKSFSITEQNKLLQQSVVFPEGPTSVIFDIDGQGCVLLQAVLRYNIPEAVINEAFSLNVSTSTVSDFECKMKKIEICTSYFLPDNKSNMAIIEIDLVSGYIPKKEDLDEIIGNETGLFKRYEINRSKVIIYVDELSAEEICASFRIRRDVDVENPKPGTVIVYDYYKPKYQVSVRYILPPPSECDDEDEAFTTVEGQTTANNTDEEETTTNSNTVEGETTTDNITVEETTTNNTDDGQTTTNNNTVEGEITTDNITVEETTTNNTDEEETTTNSNTVEEETTTDNITVEETTTNNTDEEEITTNSNTVEGGTATDNITIEETTSNVTDEEEHTTNSNTVEEETTTNNIDEGQTATNNNTVEGQTTGNNSTEIED